MTAISLGINATKLILDSVGRFAETSGFGPIQQWLDVNGYTLTALDTAFEEDPLKTTAAVALGLSVVIAAGPEIAATGELAGLVATAIAPALEGSVLVSAVNSIAGAFAAAYAENTVEDFSTHVMDAASSFFESIGGTVSSSTTPANANLFLAMPGTPGSISQAVAISLPTSTDTVNTIAVFTGSNTVTTPDLVQPPNVAGSTIEFDNGDGVIRTGRVLYQSASGLHYVTTDIDPPIDGNSGLLAIGSANVIDITSPSTSTNQDVVVSQTGSVDGGGVIQTGTSIDVQNGQTTVTSQTQAIDPNGNIIGNININADGTIQLNRLDAATGDTVLATDIDSSGNITSQTPAEEPTADYSQFVQAVADTLATQLISKVLIKNDLPASIAAQAFATTVIKSAISPAATDFSQAFANSVFNIAGGIVGSDIGGRVADAIGVPNEIGTLAGGVTGNLLTQALVNEGAKELGFAAKAGDALDAANFAIGFSGAAGAFAGSEVASLVMPTNLGGAISGAVSSAAVVAAVADAAEALFATNPITAVLVVFAAAFGSDFLGTIIGDIFGGLFGGGSSVGPGATAQNVFNPTTQTFGLTTSSADNDGDPQIARDLVNAEAADENAVMQAIGGRAASAPTDSLGYFEGTYFWAPGIQAPLTFPNTFTDPQAAVDFGVLMTLRSVQFEGGNLLMAYMLQKSTATTAQGLFDDLTAARDYSLYQANPGAFILALAMSGNASQYATWLTEQARIHELGLDAVTVLGTGSNVYGVGGMDYFVRDNTTGQLFVYEYNNLGQLIGSTNTVIDGAPIIVDAGAKVCSVGRDQFGTSGVNLYVQNRDGHTSLLTVNSQGQWSSISDVPVLGFGVNFYGTGGKDIFYLTPGGQLVVAEYNSVGVPVAASLVNNTDGSPVMVPDGSNVFGIGRGLVEAGSPDIYLQRPDGMTMFIELNVQSQCTTSGNLDVLSTGTGLFANGMDTFFRTESGQFGIVEFNTAGQQIAGGLITTPDGLSVQVLTDDTILGIARNLFSSGDSDVYVKHSNGQISLLALNNLNQWIWTNKVIGAGTNLFGSGGTDVFLQTVQGQLAFVEFNAAGQQVLNGWMTLSDGTAIQVAATDTVVHTFHNALGAGGNDIFIKHANGQTTIVEVNDQYQQLASSSATMNTDGSWVVTQTINLPVGENQVINHYSSTDQLTEADIHHTDGTRDDITYQPGAGVDHIDNFYNASGQLSSTTQDNTDGSRIETDDNLSGTGGWTKGVHFTNAAGQDTEDDLYYTDGSHDKTTWNHAGGTLVSTDNYYSATNVLINTTEDFTDGSEISIDYDNNNEGWLTGTRSFDASHNLLMTDVLYPGNGHWFYVNSLNTTMNGGSGYNGYEFQNSTFGTDTINNGGGTTAKGEVDFDSSTITDEKLWFKKVGNDLTIQKLGSSNAITIAGWYTSGQAGNDVQSIHAGGLTIDSQIATLVNAMATYQAAHSSFNASTATTMPTDTTLQNAITAAWHS